MKIEDIATHIFYIKMYALNTNNKEDLVVWVENPKIRKEIKALLIKYWIPKEHYLEYHTSWIIKEIKKIIKLK